MKRPQIHSMIHNGLPLRTRNYMHLSNYSPYSDYSHVSRSGPLADLDMSTCQVKSTTIDRIEYVNQCQTMEACVFA